MTDERGRPAEGNQVRAANDLNEGRVNLEHSRGSRRVPIARATAYVPAGRRKRYAAVVERCPHCRRAHLHYGDRWHDLSAVIKVGSCGRAYELHLRALRLAEEAA